MGEKKGDLWSFMWLMSNFVLCENLWYVIQRCVSFGREDSVPQNKVLVTLSQCAFFSSTVWLCSAFFKISWFICELLNERATGMMREIKISSIWEFYDYLACLFSQSRIWKRKKKKSSCCLIIYCFVLISAWKISFSSSFIAGERNAVNWSQGINLLPLHAYEMGTSF